MAKEVNGYMELLRQGAFESLCLKTKPEIVDVENFDKFNQKKYAEVKVIENDDVVNKLLVQNSGVYHLLDLQEEVVFNNPKTGERIELKPSDIVLLKKDNGWDLIVEDDITAFNNNFETIDYDKLDNELPSINSLKDSKCKIKETTLNNEYEKFKKDLIQKSSINLKMPSFKAK